MWVTLAMVTGTTTQNSKGVLTMILEELLNALVHRQEINIIKGVIDNVYN